MGSQRVRHDWTITLSLFFTFHHDSHAWFCFCHIGVLFNVLFFSFTYFLANWHHCFSFINLKSHIRILPFLCSWNQILPSLLCCVNQIPTNSPNKIYCVPSKMLYLLPILCSHRTCRKLLPLPLLPPYPSDSEVCLTSQLTSFSTETSSILSVAWPAAHGSQKPSAREK